MNDFRSFNPKNRLLIAVALLSATIVIAWLLTPSPLRLELVRAEKGVLTVSIDNEGTVRAHDTYVVASPIAATIERVLLHTGDTVTRGDVVAWLLPLSIDL